jgi:hypothetical protein
MSLGDALDQNRVYLQELPPNHGSKNPRHFAREYPNGDTLWDVGKMLFDSRVKSGSGAFSTGVAETLRDQCVRAYVWVVEKAWAVASDDVYLDEEAPGGTYNLDRASEYAQHAAAAGEHDRVVSCGDNPMSHDFRILRHYQAGTGRRLV